jgi:ATP-binding cassette subfamily F protein 3
LLLDEPTNHLDLEAVLWLENWLRSYEGTLLLISHDRDFLDAVVNQVAHIEQGGLTLYSGNYSDFEQARAEKLAQQQANYALQQREIAHIQSFVDRFKAKATKARQAQSRLKMLERMQRIAPAHVDSPFHFEFRTPEKNPNPLLTLEKASLGYESQSILEIKHLVMDAGMRVGLLGPNGAGKSTLIKALSGDQSLLSGERTEARDLKIGYFAQHQLDQLHGPSSPLEHLLRLDGKASEQSLRDYLGGFGFVGDRVMEPVAPFSGGEKSRLVLALLVYQRPNLLLLDEPTNHLDLEMRQALALALQEYEGAMLLVSHDRHLLRSTVDHLWLVADAGVSEFDQSLEDYPAWLAAREKTRTDNKTRSGSDRKAQKRQSAEARQQLQPLTRRLKQLEKKMDVLRDRQAELDRKLADPGLYENQADAGDKLKALALEKKARDQEMSQLEEEWMSLSEEIEVLEAEG